MKNNYAEGFGRKPKAVSAVQGIRSRAASFASFWKDLDCSGKKYLQPVPIQEPQLLIRICECCQDVSGPSRPSTQMKTLAILR